MTVLALLLTLGFVCLVLWGVLYAMNKSGYGK